MAVFLTSFSPHPWPSHPRPLCSCPIITLKIPKSLTPFRWTCMYSNVYLTSPFSTKTQFRKNRPYYPACAQRNKKPKQENIRSSTLILSSQWTRQVFTQAVKSKSQVLFLPPPCSSSEANLSAGPVIPVFKHLPRLPALLHRPCCSHVSDHWHPSSEMLQQPTWSPRLQHSLSLSSLFLALEPEGTF